MRRNRLGDLALGLAVLTGLSQLRPSRADWLYFARGGQVQAPVSRHEGRIVVDTPANRYSFQERDVLKIVPGGCPAKDWVPRRDAAMLGGADRRFAAAWWALENGLIPEAVSMLRSAHAADPSHPPTSRLVATLDRLGRACDDPETVPLRQALGVDLEVERGPHVLLLHQHDPAEARSRVDLLERVTTAYYLVLASEGFDLKTPSRRFVSVYLRGPKDYRAFLNSQGLSTFGTTQGYFHPTFRAVITYATPEPSASKARLGDLERLRLLVDLDSRARSDGTAAHEMIHLLVTESGLAPDAGDFPHWLHEGFAAQFEVVRGGRWAGVGRAHDLRLPDWRTSSTRPGLNFLIRDAGFGHGYRCDLYARSWALVYFLRHTRPREFSAFLDLLRLPGPDRAEAAPSRFEDAFRSAFGADLLALEAEWVAFMAAIRTPTEENLLSKTSPR